MRSVFLTGFMATGKTAVGRALARRLDRRFVDLDHEIERGAGLAVAEIFARFGEAEFRSRERAALGDACRIDRAVIATGGGVVVDPANRETMRAAGTIVCLTADPETILRRVGGGADRPLLAGAADRRARIDELQHARAAAYADSDLTIDTSARTIEAVAAAIESRLPAEGAGAGA